MTEENNIPVVNYERSEMHSFKNYILHGIYFSLYSLVKYSSFPLFNYLRYFILRLFSSGIKSSYISDGVTIMFPWKVNIGEHSSLNQGVSIDGTGGVEIGKGVRIAAYTVINTADHQFKKEQFIYLQGFTLGKVIIEDDVWIGTGVKINKAVRIGKGSVIGSGSVVTKNIPPYSVAAGVPCKVIKQR
jgi:acetyltransferase-like isoleucine patch superfamily enzyme